MRCLKRKTMNSVWWVFQLQSTLGSQLITSHWIRKWHKEKIFEENNHTIFWDFITIASTKSSLLANYWIKSISAWGEIRQNVSFRVNDPCRFERYVSSSERERRKAWTGLEPRPLRRRCSAQPAVRLSGPCTLFENGGCFTLILFCYCAN